MLGSKQNSDVDWDKFSMRGSLFIVFVRVSRVIYAQNNGAVCGISMKARQSGCGRVW